MVVATFGSASWLGITVKLRAMPSGRRATATRNFSGGRRRSWREKNSNQVLLTNPNNVCENPISGGSGEKSALCPKPLIAFRRG